jgi:hypothetical protein
LYQKGRVQEIQKGNLEKWGKVTTFVHVFPLSKVLINCALFGIPCPVLSWAVAGARGGEPILEPLHPEY